MVKCTSVAALAVVFGFASSAAAEELFLREKEVEVDGAADIVGGRVAEARDAAIKNAQRAAIETAIGAYVESHFSAEQKETSKGDVSQLVTSVQDRVRSDSSGWIDRQEIIVEKRDANVYKVRLRVAVRSDSLERELAKLQTLMSAVGFPKVMLLVTERFKDGFGQVHVIERPTIVPLVEEALLAKGFELADKEREPSPQELSASLGDAMRAAEVAARYGAEVAVVGSVETSQTAFNEGGDRMYYLASIINLRAVNVSTGKVMTSLEGVGKSAGASEELARVKSVRQGAPKIVDGLLEQIARAWKLEADRGKRFRINLVGIANYAKEARPFLKLTGAIANVSAVKELAFNDKKLELEVIYKGTKEQLLDAIFEKASADPRFQNLDKARDRGDEIDLKL
jgi:hypothetical protein